MPSKINENSETIITTIAQERITLVDCLKLDAVHQYKARASPMTFPVTPSCSITRARLLQAVEDALDILDPVYDDGSRGQ